MKTRQSVSAPQAGFSLLELVISVAILTIVMGAAFQLMANSQQAFDRNELLAEAHQNADFAVVRVAEMVRGAGVNPSNVSTINNIPFVSNKETPTSTADPKLIRLLSNYNGDLDYDDQVTDVSLGATYYILTSEDVTLKFYAQDTDVGNGVTVPGHSICFIDNTSSANHTPVVLASNIVDVDFTVPTANPLQMTISITGGPSKNVSPTDPRYITFTRTMQIRLRNRS